MRQKRRAVVKKRGQHVFSGRAHGNAVSGLVGGPEAQALPHRDRLLIGDPLPDRLVRSGLAESFSPMPATGRSGYCLTPKGKSLLPVLGALRNWGLAHIQGTVARMKPVI
jgi:hypothetical protein